jgi:hypothetical protein
MNITISNQYPLPLITDLLTDLSGAKIFTKLDVKDGYNNIRIKEGDEHKAAFKTKYGLWEPLVMFFGLKNSPATFQNMMNYEYRDVIDFWNARGTAIRIYMDDIAIATSTNLDDHIKAVSAVFEVAERLDLYFKPEKCTFHAPRMDYLGVILEKGITRMDPVKIAGIKNWPTPTKVKDIRSFLGFCNFYRPFIRGFAHIARPLNELTRKDAEWLWTERCQKAFDELRDRVTSEPVLAHPELDKQFELEVDASGFAVGAVLLQKKEDGKRHPIAYFSKTLNEAQRNYDIADLELLAVVMSLDNWRSFLAGSPHKVIVYSDHQNLLYWKEPHKISRRVAREVLRLSEYNIEIRHIKGTANGRADALSRRPDYDQGTEDNAECNSTTGTSLCKNHGNIEPQHRQDEERLKPWIDPHQLKQLNGVWYKEGRVVVTEELSGKRDIIRAHHDPPVHGHPGINRTIQIVERNYWWPQLRQDVKDYVQGCADCQRHKVNNRPTKAPLRPIYPKPEAMPFETIALDFITKLPESQGYDSILTVTDHDCTKAAIFIPCREEINAEGTAALYIKHVFAHFGLPRKVISDRDPRFVSKFMQEVCRITGIERNPSTAYHPRTDGQSERSNQWVETAIRFISDHHQTNWAPYLPIAQFAHNNWPSETTRKSPFFLLMGYHPRADWVSSSSPLPQVTLRLEQLKQARDTAQQLMIKAQQSWVKHRDTPKYKEGDQVWLEGKNLRLNQPTAKLAPRRHGLFKVVKVLSPVSYQLALPTQWSIHPVFHIDLLTPYRETIMHGPNYQRPVPELVDGEEEYSVEKILDSRKFGRRRRLQYLVKWEGYPDSDNMWVDKDDVFADDKVREFKISNPDKEIHIRGLSVAKSPHSSAHTRSQLLQQHAVRYAPRTMIFTNPSNIDIIPRSAPIDIPIRPLVDDHGLVLPRTPPSPTPPTTLLFGNRVETPASWPPSDDMNIETHTPPRTLGTPGSTPWAPVATLSRDPSPFFPDGPKATPEKGIDAIPLVGLGENPGTPLVGTPEYDYDLTSPPSPKDSPPTSSSASSESSKPPLPDHDYKGCTKHCFDTTYTVHHHDHTATEPTWTTATLIEERPQKHPKVWGYGMEYKTTPTWERLDRWDGWEDDELDNLRAVLGDTLKNLTSAIQRRRWN